jgi:altronate dehydratase
VGAYLSEGGDWTNASDRNLKENFASVDGSEVLQKLQGLDILRWNYKSQDETVTHIGPVAQDFAAAFNVGMDSTSISSVDPAGVALAAIKQLDETQRELAAKVDELNQVNQRMNDLQDQVAELSELVELLLAGNTDKAQAKGLTLKQGE